MGTPWVAGRGGGGWMQSWRPHKALGSSSPLRGLGEKLGNHKRKCRTPRKKTVKVVATDVEIIVCGHKVSLAAGMAVQLLVLNVLAGYAAVKINLRSWMMFVGALRNLRNIDPLPPPPPHTHTHPSLSLSLSPVFSFRPVSFCLCKPSPSSLPLFPLYKQPCYATSFFPLGEGGGGVGAGIHLNSHSQQCRLDLVSIVCLFFVCLFVWVIFQNSIRK